MISYYRDLTVSDYVLTGSIRFLEPLFFFGVSGDEPRAVQTPWPPLTVSAGESPGIYAKNLVSTHSDHGGKRPRRSLIAFFPTQFHGIMKISIVKSMNTFANEWQCLCIWVLEFERGLICNDIRKTSLKTWENHRSRTVTTLCLDYFHWSPWI